MFGYVNVNDLHLYGIYLPYIRLLTFTHIILVLTTTNYPKAKKTKVGNLKWAFLMLNGYQKEKMITNNSQENFKNM
jgi:hypothetical protein